MIELTALQRRSLRAAAHSLNPVVSISQHGLSETVVREIDRSLVAHELIKVKLYGIERDDRETLMTEICTQLHCAPVQHIGSTLVLWRPRPEEAEVKIAKPKARPMTKKQAAAAQERAPRRRRV